MTSGAAAVMTMVRDWVRVCGVGLESCTATANVVLLAAAGVPEITPVLEGMARPAGIRARTSASRYRETCRRWRQFLAE